MTDREKLLEQIKREAGCRACRHFQGLTCTAFPRGIPSEIMGGRVSHDQPYQGDSGIQWELNEAWAKERVPEVLEK